MGKSVLSLDDVILAIQDELGDFTMFEDLKLTFLKKNRKQVLSGYWLTYQMKGSDVGRGLYLGTDAKNIRDTFEAWAKKWRL